MIKKHLLICLCTLLSTFSLMADDAAVLKKLNSRYKSVSELTFLDGTTYYLVAGSNGMGAVDAQGMPFIAVREANLQAQSLAGVDYFLASTTAGLFGVYSKKGQLIVPKQYDSISVRVTGGKLYFEAHKGAKHGLFNAEGKALLPAEYTSLEVMSNAYLSYIQYAKNGKQGIVDMLGATLVPCEFDVVEAVSVDCNRAYFSVKKGTLYGAYSLSGSQLVKPAYSELHYDCVKGFYSVVKKKNTYLKIFAPEYQQFADLFFSPRYVHRLPADGSIQAGLYSLSLGAVENANGSRSLIMAVNDGTDEVQKVVTDKATYVRVLNSGVKTGIWREKDRWTITASGLSFVFHRYTLQGSSLETYITEVFTAEGENGLYAQFDVENQDGNFSWKDFMNFVDSAIARGLLVK